MIDPWGPSSSSRKDEPRCASVMLSGPGAAFEQLEPTPEVLEGLAAASYVLFEYPRGIDEFERAYAGYRAAGDGAGAARVARTLGYMYGSTSGDWAVAGGWIARAKTLLSDLPDSSERGWVALTEGMFATTGPPRTRPSRRRCRSGGAQAMPT